MTQADGSADRVPLLQRIFDNPFLLLVAGIAVMALFYTAWGLWEILTLPPAPLP
ncbi:MAG TPA: hypothetical protein VJ755_03560 [Gemmatimonadales bacterium]|nr:hypothetical protein [Gemmatimonadales bacterium]